MHSLWNSPHHGRSRRKQTIENKESNVLFGIINKYYIPGEGDSRKYHPSKYDYQPRLRLG